MTYDEFKKVKDSLCINRVKEAGNEKLFDRISLRKKQDLFLAFGED